MIHNKTKTTMKKVLITLTMVLALSMGVQAAAQKHRHTPQQELTDSTSKDAVEVYSDTTSVDTVTITKHKSKVTVTTPTSPWSSRTTTYEIDDDDFGYLSCVCYLSSSCWHRCLSSLRCSTSSTRTARRRCAWHRWPCSRDSPFPTSC